MTTHAIPLTLRCATFIEIRLRLGLPSKLMTLGLHFFCACSATIVRWLHTWGVAPGYILLRLQRALGTRDCPRTSWPLSLAISHALGGLGSHRVAHVGLNTVIMVAFLIVFSGLNGCVTARAVHLAMARGIIPLFYLLALHLGIPPTDVWRVFTNFVSDYKYL